MLQNLETKLEESVRHLREDSRNNFTKAAVEYWFPLFF